MRSASEDDECRSVFFSSGVRLFFNGCGSNPSEVYRPLAVYSSGVFFLVVYAEFVGRHDGGPSFF